MDEQKSNPSRVYHLSDGGEAEVIENPTGWLNPSEPDEFPIKLASTESDVIGPAPKSSAKFPIWRIGKWSGSSTTYVVGNNGDSPYLRFFAGCYTNDPHTWDAGKEAATWGMRVIVTSNDPTQLGDESDSYPVSQNNIAILGFVFSHWPNPSTLDDFTKSGWVAIRISANRRFETWQDFNQSQMHTSYNANKVTWTTPYGCKLTLDYVYRSVDVVGWQWKCNDPYWPS